VNALRIEPNKPDTTPPVDNAVPSLLAAVEPLPANEFSKLPNKAALVLPPVPTVEVCATGATVVVPAEGLLTLFNVNTLPQEDIMPIRAHATNNFFIIYSYFL
jgi:hypothetical protein